MLYAKQNIDSLVVTTVQQLSDTTNFKLLLEHLQYDNEVVTLYPIATYKGDVYTSFNLNLPNKLGEYKYTFYDNDVADFELETGILKLTE